MTRAKAVTATSANKHVSSQCRACPAFFFQASLLSVFLYLSAFLLILFGIAGIILPALPGVPLVFLGLLLAAWADSFVHIGWPTISLLAVLTLLSLVLDFWATTHGAKRLGASRIATFGALAGVLIGLFFALPGLLLGPFIGALLGELLHQRSLKLPALGHATRIGAGTWLGIALGIALKLGLAFSMLGIFALAWWL